MTADLNPSPMTYDELERYCKSRLSTFKLTARRQAGQTFAFKCGMLRMVSQIYGVRVRDKIERALL